jgi:hypothetical protein
MPTVLLHGWSDHSQTFARLKDHLAAQGIAALHDIWFGDYESREDALTFADVADGLHDQLVARGLLRADGTGDTPIAFVVHSTGALVVRHWLTRHYLVRGRWRDDCPVDRIVMLAPANWGSPLAHRGKSFLGMLVRGRRSLHDFLEVGRRLLDGLELGSPYQWWLAERDVLLERPPYRADGIQVTVLVGDRMYDGLKGVVNKPGTDGTVVIAGTNLDTVRFSLDAAPDAAPPLRATRLARVADVAFGVIAGCDHGTLVDAAATPGTPASDAVLAALRARSPAAFTTLRDRLAALPRPDTAYQQFLVRVRDDHDQPVDDYTLEFLVRRLSVTDGGVLATTRHRQAEEALSAEARALVAAEFHRHTVAPSHRRFLVEPARVQDLLTRAAAALGEDAALLLRVHVPPVDRGIRYDTTRLHDVVLQHTARTRAGDPVFAYPHTTTLLDVRVDRATEYVALARTPRTRGPRPRRPVAPSP